MYIPGSSVYCILYKYTDNSITWYTCTLCTSSTDILSCMYIVQVYRQYYYLVCTLSVYLYR